MLLVNMSDFTAEMTELFSLFYLHTKIQSELDPIHAQSSRTNNKPLKIQKKKNKSKLTWKTNLVNTTLSNRIETEYSK